MPRLIWTPEALADLRRLHAFLKPKNPEAASRAIATIRRGVRVLSDHPQIGRPVYERSADQREWPIPFGTSGYMALYRYDEHGVRILAVRHSREMDFDQHDT